jgi:hypothetical protein
MGPDERKRNGEAGQKALWAQQNQAGDDPRHGDREREGGDAQGGGAGGRSAVRVAALGGADRRSAADQGLSKGAETDVGGGMAKYEKPQKKNRHLLTVRQHVFPVASIARFANAEGRVSLQDLARSKVRLAKPDDGIFCANRAWDQRAERYMKRIEDEFQRLASKVIEGALAEIGESEKGVVDHFYALWHLRARRRNLPQQEIGLAGVTGGGGLTRDQEENLEINGYSFMRPDGKFVARQVNGIQLQMLSGRYADELQRQTRWGIIRAQSGEFIVPDVPARLMIPLTPHLCLISGGVTGTILESNVAEINRLVRAASHEYFFARDLLSCPF